jgi:hypothetical protein
VEKIGKKEIEEMEEASQHDGRTFRAAIMHIQ